MDQLAVYDSEHSSDSAASGGVSDEQHAHAPSNVGKDKDTVVSTTSQVTSISENRKQSPCTDDAGSTGYTESTNESQQLSFFFTSSDDETELNANLKLTKSTKTQSHTTIQNGQTGIQMKEDIPQSSFWQQNHTAIDWSDPRKIWGTSDHFNERNTHAPPTKQQKIERHQGGGAMRKAGHTSQTGLECEESSPALKCLYVHHKIAPHLEAAPSHRCHVPKRQIISLQEHRGAVNRVRWAPPQFSHLLSSASMDRTVKIWNIFSSDKSHCLRTITHHQKAVKDVIWSGSGREILSCSYDRTARLSDVMSGKQIFECAHKDFVTCVQYHPVNKNWFLSGSLNSLYCWDCRNTSKAFRKYVYKEPFGQVQDLAFLPNGTQFFTCNDLVSKDSSDKNIMAWDFEKGVVVSNQIYQERFTCTRLKMGLHGKEVYFQSQGNYIGMFSTIPPFKMNKTKRFEGHQASGYNVGCDISPDGSFVVSGSSDGRLVCYERRSGRVVRRLADAAVDVCMDVQWHPVLGSAVATSSWSGSISVWQ